MRATSLVLIGVSKIHFVLNICAYIPNLPTINFFNVLISVTIILCTDGSINNFVCLSVCLSVCQCNCLCSVTDGEK